MQPTHMNATLLREKLDRLDLDCIKYKLMDQEDGEGWSRDKADEVEKWYKRFLYLNAIHRGQSVVVNKVVDTFWHYHILDTLKYMDDCNALFGRYIHHFPYFGMRGEQDAKALENAYVASLELFQREYGEALPTFTPAAQCANVCRTPCDSPELMPSAQCANVCRTPCDSPNLIPASQCASICSTACYSPEGAQCADACSSPCDSPTRQSDLTRPKLPPRVAA